MRYAAETESRPVTIAYIESGPGFGGSPVSLYRLVKSLDKTKYIPYVVAYSMSPSVERIKNIAETEIINNVEVLPKLRVKNKSIVNRLMKNVSFYGNIFAEAIINGAKLSKIFKKKDIALVHLNNGIVENLSGLFAARFCGIPCVSHIRGTELTLKVERFFLPWISYVITLNSEMFRHYAALIGNEKVQLIFNGIDFDSLENPKRHLIRSEFRLKHNSFAIGTAARLVEGKGIPEFIKAAANVLSVTQDVRFFVIGDDPTGNGRFISEMKKLTNDLRIADYILFTGWRSDVIDVLSAMDLVVQCSTTFPEGMSLVPIEAMALGKPIIVTSIPGYENIVEEGITGFIVPPGDVEYLTARMSDVATNRELALYLGENGRRRAADQFDIKVTANRIQAIYDQIFKART